ncbi:MAG: hypothetical protein JO165_14115 [Candidatus Eremiobacteraeota bacterium]|nr:hypothetical protein [Candidatus Eremiobacteraeota bacterium]
MARRNQSSVGEELRWFGLWLLVFVVVTYLMLRLVVPHHFNDRVAIMIAGILAAVAMIALRARLTGRSRP